MRLNLSQIAQRFVGEASKTEFWPVNSSCKKGCAACCRQMVTISPSEAIRLADLIDDMPSESARVVRGRFSDAQARLEAAGCDRWLSELCDPKTSMQRHYEIAREYFALALACPFLEDEACSIHSDRPLICREYHVSSTPLSCANPFQHQVTVIPPSVRLDEAQKLMDAHLMGTEVTPIPLPLAVRWVRDHPEVRELEFDESKVKALMENYISMHTEGEGSGSDARVS